MKQLPDDRLCYVIVDDEKRVLLRVEIDKENRKDPVVDELSWRFSRALETRISPPPMRVLP